MKKQSFLITAILLKCLAQEVARYDGYKVYKVVPINSKHIEVLKTLQEPGYNFWNEITNAGTPVDVMVSPQMVLDFQHIVSAYKIPCTLMIENVQEKAESLGRKRRSVSYGMDWYGYHTWEEVSQQTFHQSRSYLVL